MRRRRPVWGGGGAGGGADDGNALRMQKARELFAAVHAGATIFHWSCLIDVPRTASILTGNRAASRPRDKHKGWDMSSLFDLLIGSASAMVVFALALRSRLAAGAVPTEASVIEALTDMPLEG